MSESSQTRKANLASHLRAAILTLELEPGADLDEVALSDAFGLSRTPLREVFRALAGEGYLSHRTNRGVRVADLSHRTLRSFFQAAPMIYKAIGQLAAEAREEAHLADLRDAQAEFQMALSMGTAADRSLSNYRFHEITAEAAGNIYLLPSMRRLLIDHARIGMTFYQAEGADPEKLATASDQHEAMIEAIAARDATRAGQLALDHWALSRSEIERFVLPTGLDAALAPVREKV